VITTISKTDKALVMTIIFSQPDRQWHNLNTPRWMSRAFFLNVVSELLIEGRVEKIKHEDTFNSNEWYGYRQIQK